MYILGSLIETETTLKNNIISASEIFATINPELDKLLDAQKQQDTLNVNKPNRRLYAYRLTHKETGEKFIKVGITNLEVMERVSCTLKRNWKKYFTVDILNCTEILSFNYANDAEAQLKKCLGTLTPNIRQDHEKLSESSAMHLIYHHTAAPSETYIHSEQLEQAIINFIEVIGGSK